ncbi:MAG: YceI family protein [Pseudomonadota bacterium]
MRPIKKLLIAASLLTSTSAFADLSKLPDGEYRVDPQHGYILFTYSHLGLSEPRVGFNRFDATIDLKPSDPTNSAIAVTIDVASVDSRVEALDGHLRSENFFDVENHPEITFTATSIAVAGDGYAITGNVTIKGITQPLTLDAKVASLERHPIKRVPAIGVSARGKLARSEIDLGDYIPAVSDDVSLIIEAEFLLR